MCSERSLRGSYIYQQYAHCTHINIHAYLCSDQPLKRKRHFFCCTANKEIWHLVAIRRAVIFDVDFVINGEQDGHCVNGILYIGSRPIHTLSHTRIVVHRSAINVTSVLVMLNFPGPNYFKHFPSS